MNLAQKFIIDTNVPLTANRALSCPENSEEWLECAENCIALLQMVINTKEGLVLDKQDEIFSEYSHKLSFRGQPGLGDVFFKWLHDNRYSFPEEDRVQITKNKDTYDEFPDHHQLKDFDISDRKFVATANAHPAKIKPTIYQATDSKWWGWRKALKEVKIPVYFLCEKYVKKKYQKKFPGQLHA